MQYDLLGYPIIEEPQIFRIPYQGSKNSIAIKLLKKMLDEKPKAKYFVDLFGGGGSMSFTALQMGLKVIYNEKQTGLVNFIRYIFDRVKTGEKGKYGLFPNDFYKFITREEFKKLKDEDSIKGQFARICYSFGNNQKDYLFGDIEKTKHLAHNIVMFQCEEALKEFNLITQADIKISKLSTWNERRIAFRTQIRDRRQLAELEQLEQLERLEQLEQLERLQQLERLDNIQLFNLDYKDVIINTPPEETIVYLDPPYRNTAGYIEGLNYDELDDYFRGLPYLAFMSEYQTPFNSILEIKKVQLFNNSKVQKTYAIEKLFINQ